MQRALEIFAHLCMLGALAGIAIFVVESVIHIVRRFRK